MKDSRTRAADLESPFHGVRAPAGSAATLVGRCSAYVVRMPLDGYFTHITAAQLHGIPLPRRLDERDLHVSVLLPHRAPRGRGIAGHACGPPQRVENVAGLPVLSAAETWCQLGHFLGLDELIAAGDRLLGRPHPLTSRLAIEAALDASRGKRDAKLLRQAYPLLRERVESPRETMLRLAVVRAGLPEPEVNIDILDASGRRIAIGDLVYERERVLLEYDGEHHRHDIGQYSHDVDRLNALAAAGWIVVRVGKRTNISAAIALTRHALSTRRQARE